jgi:hypothetical protein
MTAGTKNNALITLWTRITLDIEQSSAHSPTFRGHGAMKCKQIKEKYLEVLTISVYINSNFICSVACERPHYRHLHDGTSNQTPAPFQKISKSAKAV